MQNLYLKRICLNFFMLSFLSAFHLQFSTLSIAFPLFYPHICQIYFLNILFFAANFFASIFLSLLFSLRVFFPYILYYFLNSFSFPFILSTYHCSFASISSCYLVFPLLLFPYILSSDVFAPVFQVICPSIHRTGQMNHPLWKNVKPVFLPTASISLSSYGNMPGSQ